MKVASRHVIPQRLYSTLNEKRDNTGVLDMHFRDNERGTLARTSKTDFLDTEQVTLKYLGTDTHFRDNERCISARISATAFLDSSGVLLLFFRPIVCAFLSCGLNVPLCSVGLAMFCVWYALLAAVGLCILSLCRCCPPIRWCHLSRCTHTGGYRTALRQGYQRVV